MIKVSSEIPLDFANTIDEILYEIAPSNWVYTKKKPKEVGFLEGYFYTHQEVTSSIKILREISPEKFTLEFTFSEIRNEDWKNSYKKHFDAWEFRGFHVVPIWQKKTHEIPDDHKALYLDPSMAFGTGNHETTRMCVESLVSLKQSHKDEITSLLDVGCGSGILTLVGGRLLFKENLGIDNDSNSIKVAYDNLLLNDLSTHILFENKSVEQINLSRSFDVVISNIQSDVLCTNASTLINCMSEKGHLILSGILNTEKNEVSSVFEKEANRVGFRFSTTYTSLSEWTTIKISKQP